MTEKRTLEVRLDRDEQQTELLEDIRALERGEEIDERHVLVLENERELQRLLSPANLELLRTIREHEPESMRAAAELVDRDFKEVHRNLTELDALNVLELEEHGRSKRPVVRFDELDIELSLDSSDTDVATA
jgi:predicted transcriptional regulator